MVDPFYIIIYDDVVILGVDPMKTIFIIEFENQIYELKGNSLGKEELYQNNRLIYSKRSFSLKSTFLVQCPTHGLIYLSSKLSLSSFECLITISKSNEILYEQKQLIHHMIPNWAQADSNTTLKSTKRRIISSLLSMVLAIIIFGFLFSFEIAPILVVALFIHELGHFLAMALFKYQNINIIFAPPLGALATGYKKEPIPWQEMIILLAGPLPGILIAIGLYLSNLTIISTSFTQGMIYMFLIINYFNLIPISPLDGGRIVELVFLHKYPKLQIIFASLGALVLLILGIVGQEIFVLVMALLFVFILMGRLNGLKKQESKNVMIIDHITKKTRLIIGSSYLLLIVSSVFVIKYIFL
jgi:Zn-dependent protease